MSRKKNGFKLYEKDGYSEKELMEGDSLEELIKKLKDKTGYDL